MRLSSSRDEFKLRRAAAFAVVFCACLPSVQTVWEQFYQRLELNTDSWSAMQAQQIVCKTIVYKNKQETSLFADILNSIKLVITLRGQRLKFLR